MIFAIQYNLRVMMLTIQYIPHVIIFNIQYTPRITTFTIQYTLVQWYAPFNILPYHDIHHSVHSPYRDVHNQPAFSIPTA